MTKELNSALQAVEKSDGKETEIVFLLPRIKSKQIKFPRATIAGIAADLDMDQCRRNAEKFKRQQKFGPAVRNFRIERLVFGGSLFGIEGLPGFLYWPLKIGQLMTIAGGAWVICLIIAKILGV